MVKSKLGTVLVLLLKFTLVKLCVVFARFCYPHYNQACTKEGSRKFHHFVNFIIYKS